MKIQLASLLAEVLRALCLLGRRSYPCAAAFALSLSTWCCYESTGQYQRLSAALTATNPPATASPEPFTKFSASPNVTRSDSPALLPKREPLYATAGLRGWLLLVYASTLAFTCLLLRRELRKSPPHFHDMEHVPTTAPEENTPDQDQNTPAADALPQSEIERPEAGLPGRKPASEPPVEAPIAGSDLPSHAPILLSQRENTPPDSPPDCDSQP